jgi:transposase
MSDLMLLSAAQMRRIEPYFPLSHGVPRVDDRLIVSGHYLVLRNGLRWRDTLVLIVRSLSSLVHVRAMSATLPRVAL